MRSWNSGTKTPQPSTSSGSLMAEELGKIVIFLCLCMCRIANVIIVLITIYQYSVMYHSVHH